MLSWIQATLSITLFYLSSSEIIPFDKFVEQYGRKYTQGSNEYNQRLELFEKTKVAARLQNSDPARLWTAGVNKLWDWTEDEMQSLRGWDGSVRPNSRGSRAVQPHGSFLQQRKDLPKEKVWDNLTMAHRVKNQGACGSCWAIAAATVLEAHQEIYSGTFRSFSAQQIVSCTPNPRECGGQGQCKGATAELAMEWVLHHGCADEDSVPYLGHDGECTANPQPQFLQQASKKADGGAAFGMVGWETLPKNTYEPLVRALAERGPVAVSVGAEGWNMYESGIFNGCGKDTVINHAVTAIGYGEQDGHKYWLIQNSWGIDWGEMGHIRLERHDGDEYCGMNDKPQLGVACKGENDPVPVCGMCGVLFDSVVPHFQQPHSPA